MKSIKYNILAATVALATTACTSYEIDMPANPEPPKVGNEVSTNVIYEANPRMFAQQECLKAVTAQLPRISDMGCDIIWIMPVYEPGELNAIGSPYCIRDFKKLNPKYGTMDDLKALVSDAHSRGMKVLFDWIANHTSWDSPWITEHPDRYKKDDAGNIVSPDGWADVAQLDFNNPATCEALIDAMVYWVKEVGIDGYRCDYATGVPHAFWTEAISALRAVSPELIMLAEASDYSFYDDGFNMIYDWNSSTSISAAFTGGKATEVITEATGALAKVPDGKSILRYVINHDTAAEKDVDKLFGSYEALPAAYVLASMLNGTPMIYSSMDVEGLSGKQSFFNYSPMTFSPKLTETYKTINAAFKASAELRRGPLADYSNKDVVCFTRAIPGKYLLVAVNTTKETKSVRSPINLAESTMTDLVTGASINLPMVIQLEPYSYVIYVN